ncbi:hypothetical protein BKA65DRAFT_547990 [Rhexocercosporidium sp. MPI-PUGE-AT-0058]|nr:hypothetical protein BKA65DRAFT_547990 [Rhexocercosporidium sp. MPI-PUGE-AT-0058]
MRSSITSAIFSMILGATARLFSTYQFFAHPYLPLLTILESQASFANESFWIGYTKYKQYSQRWQNMYIFANETAHGHAVPPEAIDHGFGFDEYGNWNFQGQNKFVACQTREQIKRGPYQGYQIWWKGAGSVRGVNCIELISLVKAGQPGTCGNGH